MKKRKMHARSRVLVSVLLALILLLNASLAPALPISADGQAAAIAQPVTDKPGDNPPPADRTSTAVPDLPVSARPDDGRTVRLVEQDAVEVTSLEEAATLVYAHTHPAQPIPVEYKLTRDIREIAQLLDWASTSDLTPAEKAVVWDLLASKREELRVNERVLAQKFEDKRTELRSAGPSIAAGQFDVLVTRAQEKMSGLARVLDDVLATRDAKHDTTLAVDTARSCVAQLTPSGLVNQQSLSPAPPPFRLPDADPDEFMTINAPEEMRSSSLSNVAPLAPPPPTSEDLDPTLEIQITPEIIALAAALNNSPTAIYEYVRDNFDYTPYYGSLMGSTAVLWSGNGNDHDQASLLLALLRAAGISSRYVSGQMRIYPQQAQDWLGVTDVLEAAQMLGVSGITVTVTTDDGTPEGNVLYLTVDHVWVEAYVPYGNYRGLINDTSDYVWIPMDPSFQLKTYQDGIDVSGCGEFDYDNYLSSIQRFLPHELYQDQLLDCLHTNFPGKTLADVGYVGTLNESNFDFLPASLPYHTVGDVTRFSEVDDALRHKVTVKLEEGETTLFETTLTLPEVSLDRLTISYEDLGGNTWRPVLKRNGTVIATGSNTTLGNINTLTYGLIVPGQAEVDETVYPRLTVGEHNAMFFYVHQASQRLLDERSQQLLNATGLIGTPGENPDDLTGELLFIALIKYNMRMDEALQAVDEIKKHVTLSQTRIGMTKAAIDVLYMGELPFAVFPDDLLIDFKRNVVYPAPIDGDHSDPTRLQSVMKLGGYSVSALEHQIWEDLVKLDSISTMKGLQKANELGLTIHVCTDVSCINSTLLDQGTKDKLIAEINNGKEITVPHDEFNYEAWEGAVWITRDPATGAAGYIISGGFDGGSTATTTIFPERPFDLGTAPYVTTARDPVNIANGNLIHTETDFTLKSRTLSLNWIRTYNSKLDYDGPMGYGWTHTYNTHLVEDGSGDVTLMDADGAQHLFTKQPDDSYEPPPGVHSTLTKSGSEFTLREKNGLEYHYALNGQLLSIVEPNGNQVTLAYDGNGRLTTITDPVGRTLTLAYDANDRLISINDFTGRQWTYTYDADGNLTSVTDPLSNTTTYTYYATQYNEHNIHQIIDGRGNAMTFVYYTNDKVFSHTNDLGETSVFSYNPFWQETRVVNEEGYIRNYVYDEDGHLIELTEETGGVHTYTWDADRNLLSHTDPLGHTTTYTYDDRGNLTSKVNSLGHTITYQYEATFNKPTQKDDNGHVSQMAYDSYGNLTSVTDALGNVTTTAYDAYGQPTVITGPLGNVTTNTYDANGNLTQVEDALGNITQTQYDALGRPIRIIDANNHATTTLYDDLDRLLQVTDTLTNTTQYAYDAVDNQTVITDALGHVTTHVYDAANRRVQTIDALGNVTTFEYDGLGNLTAQTDPLGHRMTFEYNGLNNQTRVIDPLGNISQSIYDANSNLLQTIDANGNVATNEYDALNRPVRTTDPLGNVTQYQYDAWGNITVSTDALGNVTQNFYDDLNRLVRTRDALGQETTYQYDALGNLTQLTDANGHLTTQQFDLLSCLTAVTDALGNTTAYEYDGVGNQTRITDANGQITDLAYDELDRLVERSHQGGGSDTFQYDAVGNMLQAAGSAVTLDYEYDDLDRITRLTDSRFNKSIQYSYDAAGNLTQETNPEGGVTAYNYDRANRLVGQIEPDGLTIFYAYDPVGNRTERSLSLGHRTVYSYDAANRLTSLINYGPDDEVLSQNVYSYDAVGNVLSMTDLQGTHTYTYNDVYWLNAVTYPWGDFENFTCDAAGNRLTRTDNSGTTSYTYNDANQLLTAGPVSFVYDANGNLVQRTDAGGTTTYAFDQRNQLVGVQFPAGSGLPDTAIEYNALGDRVRKVDSGGEMRYFVNDTREVVAEYNESNTWQTTYQHGPGLDELIGRTTTSQTYYYLTDALGSVVAIVDALGQQLARYDYKAFGEIASQTGSLTDNQGFTGRERDPDSGLLYMRARYYDPVAGRFISVDPIGYQGGINLYAYAGNNPIRFIDPNGTNPEEWLDYDALDLIMSSAALPGQKLIHVQRASGPYFRTVPGGKAFAPLTKRLTYASWALAAHEQLSEDKNRTDLDLGERVARTGVNVGGAMAATAVTGLAVNAAVVGVGALTTVAAAPVVAGAIVAVGVGYGANWLWSNKLKQPVFEFWGID